MNPGIDSNEDAAAQGDSTILSVQGLTKVFDAKDGSDENGRVVAVDRLSFTVDKGKLFTLLGPSGCGKTTTLRSIAGLERPSAGEIRIDGRLLFSSKTGTWVPANRRGLGMVFQSYAIWPHMNVEENTMYPLTVRPRAQRLSKKEQRERTERVLTIVELDHLASRPATDLSGGQQQRLALARALIMEPPLLLLDEPLSNLDAKLRAGMRLELKRLQQEIGVTAVYVTHDQVEALAISDTLAVMDHGVIQQVGQPRTIYDRPNNLFVADFIGTSNMIGGRIQARSPDGGYVVDTAHGVVEAATGPDAELEVGADVFVSVRPEHVTLSVDEVSAGPNRWRGRVLTRAFLGEAVDHLIQVGTLDMKSKTNPHASVAEGEEVTLSLEREACHVVGAG